ncbi:MAG: hypothetical protein UW18_C0017G0020, partial [Microgenomates group bacterium GW2011_GWF1_44_10]
ENIKAVEFPELLRMVQSLTGDTPTLKSFKRALGRFYGKGEGIIKMSPEIFKDPKLSVRVFAHEIGHMADFFPDKTLARGNMIGRIHSLNKYLRGHFGDKEVTNTNIRSELKELSQEWKPFNELENPKFTGYRYSSKELYADAISVLFNDPALLKEKAPTFYKAFFEALDTKPEILKEFNDTWNLINEGEEAVFNARNEAMDKAYKTAEDKWTAKTVEKKARKLNLLHTLQVLFDDRNAPLNRKVNIARKKGLQIDDRFNLISEYAGLNYLDGKLKNFVNDNFTPAYDLMKEVDGGWETLGKVLQLERSANERGELANPGGYSPATANEQLEGLKAHTAPEDWAKVEKSLGLFRSGMDAVVKMAEDVGYYTPQMLETMKANETYATFQVIDYLDTYISSAIHKQVGTLKDVANPATSSIMKAISTMKAIEYNNARTMAVDFHAEAFADELTPAKKYHDGKRWQILDPKEPTQGLVTIIRNGKPEGYYMEKETADTINRTNDKTIMLAAKLSQKLTASKIYRPLFTSLNLGFQSFNAVRDFMRYWKNIPDRSLKDAITSFPRALYRYKQASGHAWNRVTSKPDAIIKAMENSKILGQTYNDTFGDEVDPEEKQIERVMNKAGVTVKAKKRGLLSPVYMLLDGIELLGNYIESLPKVAGYLELREIMPEKELARFIRTRIGSPDFLTRGTFTPVSNNIFLFSNAIKEGMKTDYQSATDPKTRGGFWWKTIIANVLPKVILMGIGAGLFGDWWKKRHDDMSEYDKTNYNPLVLGVDINGKTIYLRIPQDETGRFIGGLFYKLATMGGENGLDITDLFDVFSYGAGQMPNLSPAITGTSAILSYMSGQNPYDEFRHRNIIPDAAFKAGPKYSFPIFMDWLIKNQGAGVIMPSYTPEGDLTNLEKILNLPLISNILGRWVKVSDYGQSETLKEISTEADKEAAQKTLENRQAVNDAIKAYKAGPKTAERRIEAEKAMIKERLGEGPYDSKERESANRLISQFKVGLIKGNADANTDAIIYANTNAEKVKILQHIKTGMEEAEFKDFVNGLHDNKLISDEVIIELKKAIPETTKQESLLNFKLVKEAFAAEDLVGTYKSMTWSKDIRTGWERFLGGVQALIPGEQAQENPIEGITEKQLVQSDKEQYWRAMTYLKAKEPGWYFYNVGEKVEERILGGKLSDPKIKEKFGRISPLPETPQSGPKQVEAITVPKDEEATQEATRRPGRVTQPAKGTPPIKNPDKEITLPSGESATVFATPYDDYLDATFGDKADEARRVLNNDGSFGENPSYNPGKGFVNPDGAEQDINYIEGHWGEKGYEKYVSSVTGAKVDKSDPNAVVSRDMGLMRINNGTYYDFMNRANRRKQMEEIGITSIEDLYDPEKNIKVAKLNYDEGGWIRWYAAPDDLK